MSKVKLRILSKANGESTIFSAHGEWTRENAENVLVYPQDDSIVCISEKNGYMTMERQGDCYLFLPFQKGSASTGYIGIDKNTKGEIPVQTESVTVEFTDSLLTIELKYVLPQHDGNQNRNLRIIAEKV